VIEKYKILKADKTTIGKFYSSALKKFVKAKKVLCFDEETAYQMFYEAMLKASLALMLSYGLRPRGLPGHHINIIEFCEKKLGKEYENLLNSFDKMRRKRNQAIYQPMVVITETEAKNALEVAEKYLLIIKKRINKDNPQLSLRI
jgi:uncharacterized protein (UPF0332 family)